MAGRFWSPRGCGVCSPLRHGAGLAFLRGKMEGMRRFRGARGTPGHPEALSAILDESENEIHDLQRQTGYDLYWRLYFALDMSDKLGVVIVTYNSGEMIERCLESAQVSPLTVVDNASSDDTLRAGTPPRRS